jgi:hypothetical protein
MKNFIKGTDLFACVFSMLLLQACSSNHPSLEGHWKILPEQSSSIDPWNTITLDILSEKDTIAIVTTYGAGNPYDIRMDSIRVNTFGIEQTAPIPPGRWLGEVSMGVYYGPASVRHVTARWNADRSELNLESRETLETSQGEVEATSRRTFSSSSDGSTLTVTETRSTRSSGSPIKYVFARRAK